MTDNVLLKRESSKDRRIFEFFVQRIEMKTMMACLSVAVSGAASLGTLLALLFAVILAATAALRFRQSEKMPGFRENDRSELKISRDDDDDEDDDRSPADGSPDSPPPENGKLLRANRVREPREETMTPRGVSPESLRIRELVEELVATLVGGPLDGTTVGKMSTHSSYLAIFQKYHGLLCEELTRLSFTLRHWGVRENAVSSALAEAVFKAVRLSLNRLIRRVISEAVALPNIKEILCLSVASDGFTKGSVKATATPGDNNQVGFVEKTYEDILATAILNKVIVNLKTVNGEKEKEEGEGSREHFRLEKAKKHVGAEDACLENWSRNHNHLSMTVEERIEEVTTTIDDLDVFERESPAGESVISSRRNPLPEPGRGSVHRATIGHEGSSTVEEDLCDAEGDGSATADLVLSSTGSWEENWLFQKKKRPRSTPNAHHPVPVPMLVPKPSEDFRALVGGIDADELSDMSECSDSALEDIVGEPERPAVTKEDVTETPDWMADRTACRAYGETHGGTYDRHRPLKTPNRMCAKEWPGAQREGERMWKRRTRSFENPSAEGGETTESQRAKIGSSRDVPGRGQIGEPATAPGRIPENHHVRGNESIGSSLEPPYTKSLPAGTESVMVESSGETVRRAAQGIGLPSVRELALRFGAPVHRTIVPPETGGDSRTGKADPGPADASASRPPPESASGETDHGPVPVSEIVRSLTNAGVWPESRSGLSSDGVPRPTARRRRATGKPDRERFPAKEVHSLTARSISREFREGLRKGADAPRAGTGGDGQSDRVVVGSRHAAPSPTPSIDLARMRKFWEEVTTANSIGWPAFRNATTVRST